MPTMVATPVQLWYISRTSLAADVIMVVKGDIAFLCTGGRQGWWGHGGHAAGGGYCH
jgi:hypothetical protein